MQKNLTIGPAGM